MTAVLHNREQVTENSPLFVRKDNRQKHFSLFPVFALCSLLFFSCDIFTGPKVDLFQVISDEVDWANAPKLSVTVAFPPEWGNSPQSGEGKCGDTRKGYEFGVEFTPLSGYGFEKWLAFLTADYAGLDKNVNAGEAESYALNNGEVAITEGESDTGAKTAGVTINITEPVTLVPWCGNRPRLAQQTNPPLNPILTPFPYDQIVNIWFTMPVNPATLTWENIHVTGIYSSGNNRGQFFNDNGGLTAYFNIEIPYFEDNGNRVYYHNRLNLIPKPETASELALLSISVTVGQGVESMGGVSMAQAETISYQTDTREAQKVYRAVSVSASRNAGSGYWTDTDYTNPTIDRRFKQTDQNTVYVRFSVDAPSGEGIPLTPNKIRIVESMAYNLRGGSNVSGRRETEYAYPGTGVTLSGGMFTITHTMQTGDWDGSSGIIQLLVLPLNEGEPDIAPMPENEAISEGRYVTVVMDNAAPEALADLRAGFPENSWSSRDGNTYTFGAGAPMTLTLAGLGGVEDNGGAGGIPASRAYSLPWTMEEPQKMSWYAQIGSDAQVAAPLINTLNSDWQGVYKPNGADLNDTWELANLSGLTPDETYPVRVKFRDSLGNVSGWNETPLRVKYSTAAIETASNIRAEYTAANSRITIEWDEAGAGWTGAAGTYPYPEVVITAYRASAQGDIEESMSTVTRNRNVKSYSFTAPRITDSGVRNGDAVSGVYGYKVSVVTRNVAGDATAGPIWIYNIPEMSVNQSNTVLLNNSNFSTALTAAGSSGKNFILTQDITINTAWTPVGTSVSGQEFQGKLYGAGHTIALNSGFSGASLTDTGVFGVTNNALIRDLAVEYASASVTNGTETGDVNVGGIAGNALGSTAILNCIVRGADTASILNVTASGSFANTYRLGGVAGYMLDTAYMQNCRAALNVTLSTASNKNLFVGGAVGFSSSTSTLTDISSVAVVSMNKTNNALNVNNCGGIAGSLQYTNLTRCVFSGRIDIPATFNANASGSGDNIDINSSYIGGLVGNYSTRGIADNCAVTGDIIVRSSGTTQVYLGGVAGKLQGMSTSSVVEMTNTSYSDGTIQLYNTYVNAAASYHRIGGFVGSIFRYGNVRYCQSHAKGVTVQVTAGRTGILVGGFSGQMIQVDISDCYSTSPVIVPATHVANGIVFVGGFSGNIESRDGVGSNIENCFATGDVTAHCAFSSASREANDIGGFIGNASTNATTDPVNTISQCYATGGVTVVYNAGNTGSPTLALRVGGLVGLAHGTSISECYATGSVTAQKRNNGTMDVLVGGLVGLLGWNNVSGNSLMSSVTDCYATGNVTADINYSPSPFTNNMAALYAGGLVGYMQIDAAIAVTRNFASGSVSARSTSSGNVYSGGIVGYRNSGLLQNNAALGASVTVKGENNNRKAARIYAYPSNNIGNKNYAKESMKVRTSENYTDIIYTPVDPVSGHTTGDGVTAEDNEFHSPYIWTDSNHLGFSADIWDFSGVVKDEYPKLKGVGGQ